MKTTILLAQLLLNIETLQAFSPSISRGSLTHTSTPSTRVFMSQWDDEDEDIVQDRKSFDDAGIAMKDEEEQKQLEEMGDYDTNEDYNDADISRVRDAIKERAESLGLERSKVSVEAIQAAQEQAKSAVENKQSGASMLDLSQISAEAPRGEMDENLPAMFFEPEAEMSEEEMIEADPDGQLSFMEQAMKEIKAATWPTPAAVIKEVALLLIVGGLSGVILINWDNVLREFYTNVGLIPSPEEITKGTENLVLPEGWTDGMSEDDYMNFRDEVGSSSPSVEAVKQGFPNL